MIDEKEVLRIASLSRLKLTDEQIKSMREHLERTLDSFAVLDSVPLKVDCSAPSKVSALRVDEVGKTLDREKLLRNAPDTDGETFIVPKVLE